MTTLTMNVRSSCVVHQANWAAVVRAVRVVPECWLGLEDREPEEGSEETEDSLSNHSVGWSFEVIRSKYRVGAVVNMN